MFGSALRGSRRCGLLSLPWNLRKCGMLCASFANHAASFHCHFCEQKVGMKNTQQSTKQTVNKMVHIATVAVEAEDALRQIIDVVDLVDESDSYNDDADTDMMESTTGGAMLEKTPSTPTKILVTSVPTKETPTRAGEKATEPASARVIPEYPHKTKKLKPPHPDWRVMLPRPRCIDNDEGDLEWVFFYFSNKRTGKVTWTPPPFTWDRRE